MTFFAHLLHDMQNMDEAIRLNEEARWSRFLVQVEDLSVDDGPLLDPYDDGDDEL